MFNKKNAIQAVSLSHDYHAVFDTPEGRRVLADMAKRGYFLSPVTDISSKANSEFNDGKRTHFLETLNILRMDINEAINFLKGIENE